jgi:CheY-like chemotaxis protein
VILVIDDEPGITELLSDILESYGHPVLVAGDAEEALNILQLQRPDVVLVDIMMPSVDGLSLALALRHHPVARAVPLVAMSASDSALALADRTGDFNAHISKPFENDELVDLIERVMQDAQSARRRGVS